MPPCPAATLPPNTRMPLYCLATAAYALIAPRLVALAPTLYFAWPSLYMPYFAFICTYVYCISLPRRHSAPALLPHIRPYMLLPLLAAAYST
ncbi:hypothetical protein TNCV_1190121 [Trichonephila clavipes]|nr:hypothetical protein TNCV_1190121 [Trichonephila clavipes]